MRMIAFTGPKTCGKDTAAKCLFKQNTTDGRNYFRHAQQAGGIKNFNTDFFGWTQQQQDDPVFKETPIQLYEGGPTIEPRWVMMDVANWLRDKYGPAIHAVRNERHCLMMDPYWGAHVVTDLRFPDAEVPMLRRHDSLIIYIERDEAEEKLKSAQAAGDAKALNPSEIHYATLRAEADIIIPNNDGVHHLHNAVVTAVRNRFDHWSTWGVPESLLDQMRKGTY